MGEPIVLIPARGGSKGIPKKNLQPVGELSLLNIAIKVSLESNLGTVWVSTDDEGIGKEGNAAGAKIWRRHPSAGKDDATANDVVRDFLDSNEVEVVIYLQPTSPFRTACHINDAWKLFIESGGAPVVSVKGVTEHPGKMVSIVNGKLRPFLSASMTTANRQSLEALYIPNGAIYLFHKRDFQLYDSIPIENAIPFLMSDEESIDIDSPLDLEIANHLTARD